MTLIEGVIPLFYRLFGLMLLENQHCYCYPFSLTNSDRSYYQVIVYIIVYAVAYAVAYAVTYEARFLLEKTN
jgi:hypothetical protein